MTQKPTPGTFSVIALLLEGSPFLSTAVMPLAETVNWDLGGIIPVGLLTLRNTGSSTIYIRNLTTE
jgi:hypothetical protein